MFNKKRVRDLVLVSRDLKKALQHRDEDIAQKRELLMHQTKEIATLRSWAAGWCCAFIGSWAVVGILFGTAHGWVWWL